MQLNQFEQNSDDVCVNLKFIFQKNRDLFAVIEKIKNYEDKLIVFVKNCSSKFFVGLFFMVKISKILRF